jgi:heparanase
MDTGVACPMSGWTRFSISKMMALATLAGLGSSPALCAGPVTAAAPAKMPRVATIDERYQSYNIEMLEVTGGRFWAPYKQGGDAPAASSEAKPDAKASALPGQDPSLYRYRPPIDLSSPRLRKLAAEAKKFLAYTQQIGGSIAAAEMFNEPSFASMGGAPKGYDAAMYGRDFKVFHPFVKQAAPEMVILGPGSVGESGILTGGMPGVPMLKSEDMLAASGPGIDAFSYHFYGGVSKRCGRGGQSPAGTTPEAALSVEWLSRTDRDEAYYAALRDRFLPGGAIWNTETGETACGGDPWAADFIDSFRYLNQLGTLAKRGVQVVIHNTLAASDYALVDETTLLPRPNYWSALLWSKMMGTTVLDAGPSPSPNLHLYAHCLRHQPGGVALLAINADRTASQELDVPTASERYTLTAKDLMDNKVELNGSELNLANNGDLPPAEG